MRHRETWGAGLLRHAVVGLVALGVAFPLASLAPASPAGAASGACGEQDRLPGPGRYTGGFKGTLVRTVALPLGPSELALPLGGSMEVTIDDAGHVTGTASSQFEPSPTDRAGMTASGGLQLTIDGQLSDPYAGSSIPASGQGQADLNMGPLGRRLPGWQGPTTVSFNGWQRAVCAGVQGTWTLDSFGGDAWSGYELRDAVWAAKVDGFDENLERQVRGAVGQLIQQPPADALGLPATLATPDADLLADGLWARTAGLPTQGLFALYTMVDQSPAVAAQKNCLLDLIKTAIAGKLQQYLGAGFNQSYEEDVRLADALVVQGIVGATPACAARAAGLDGLKTLTAGLLQQSIAASAPVDRIQRLTRIAVLFGWDDVAEPGRQYLAGQGARV
ncbi:MAG: hypothetical protein IT307_09155 [Chloroflexi bacterium]|nr:hypothetical protein [Chloroflexota bacterium]